MMITSNKLFGLIYKNIPYTFQYEYYYMRVVLIKYKLRQIKLIIFLFRD